MNHPPAYLQHLVQELEGIRYARGEEQAIEWFDRFRPPPGGGRRQSAVLLAFGPALEPVASGGTRNGEEGAGSDVAGGESDGQDVRLLITERAAHLRSHAGQAAFPGGRQEPGDASLVHTALRESEEEVGLDPSSVSVLTTLPTVHIPVSGYDVTPVIGWWQRPHPVGVFDPGEVARVEYIPVAALQDPANRLLVRHPFGYIGPAFDVQGLLVWGFTAALLDRVMQLAGLERDWDRSRIRELDV